MAIKYRSKPKHQRHEPMSAQMARTAKPEPDVIETPKAAPVVEEVSEPVPAPAEVTPAVPEMWMGTMVKTAVYDPADQETHIERINGYGNPAAIPGVARDASDIDEPPTDAPKPHMLTAPSFHDGKYRRAGETVMVHERHIGEHHVPLKPAKR